MKLIKQTDILTREEALKKIDEKIHDEIYNLSMVCIGLEYVDNGFFAKKSRMRVQQNVLDVAQALKNLRDLRWDIQISRENRFRLELD